MDDLEELRRRVTNSEINIGNKHLENVARLTKLETILEDIRDRLFGNGQPGIIEKYEKRLTTLEAMAIKIGAIAAVLIFLIEVLHTVPIRELLGFGK